VPVAALGRGIGCPVALPFQTVGFQGFSPGAILLYRYEWFLMSLVYWPGLVGADASAELGLMCWVRIPVKETNIGRDTRAMGADVASVVLRCPTEVLVYFNRSAFYDIQVVRSIC
jgi:hypothetical protein